MKITVKKTEINDIEFIALLERETFSLPQSEKELLRMQADDSNILLTAFCDGERAGYIGAYTVAGESDIVTVATSPAFRRRGVARELLLSLFEQLSGKSEMIFLEVRESNTAARTLYESMGFAKIGTRRGYYKNPSEDAVLYKKEL